MCRESKRVGNSNMNIAICVACPCTAFFFCRERKARGAAEE